MNKKISTLFTAGLLVAGSLCGSAWAQDAQDPETPGQEQTTPEEPQEAEEGSILDYLGWSQLPAESASELKDGAKYLIVNEGNAYGFNESAQKLLNATTADGDILTKDTDVQKFIWEVSTTPSLGTYSYTFTNVASGKQLTVSKVNDDPTVTLADNGGAFYFGEEKAAYSDDNQSLYMYVPKTDDDEAVTYTLSWGEEGLIASTDGEAGTVFFYEVPSVGFTNAAELNALYNTSGFTFESKKLDSDQSAEAIGNLFNEKRITAVYVSGAIDVDATEFPSYSGDNADLNIPAGMYFFTENAPIKADGTAKTSYKDWMNATIVVVSSTETVEATNAGRANGDGFSLVEMKVSDLNFYQGSNNAWKTAGNEVSINNACFTVEKSLTDSYPYALGLANFRYRVQASKADHAQKAVQLHVLKHNDNYYLTTENIEKITDMNEFIFKLAPAGMKKGIELLNTEAKVAAFNIRVLSGDNSEVKSLYGKYLTNAVKNGSFEFVAKAKVLAQPETPAYQWAITSIDDTYDVTFTNRETDEHFTASLFPKTDMGENVYELAIADADYVTPIYVDENTYNEKANEDATTGKKSMQGLVVELTPAEIDPYAGFLNVDDKTLVTMAFARDSYETSNKWYAGVEETATGYALNANGEFSNKLSGAAQWQLVKSKNAQTILDRSFVYNRDGRVTVQARGDKAYAYSYQLQYVTDGKEMKVYFPAAERVSDAVRAEQPVNAVKANFIIKQAADGAVYLIKLTSTDAENAVIFNSNTASGVKVVYSNSADEYQYAEGDNHVYAYPETQEGTGTQDWILKTYLIEEAPEVSYPAEEGYISLISELGNYISINENREGIVVDEAQYSFYLNVTDTNAVVPSFYISKAIEGSKDRAYLFNPIDSVNYYVAEGSYDREYQWAEEKEKALFKAGTLNAGRDTIATDIKGERVNVADKADDEGVFGGLDNFKVQIVLVEDSEDQYYIRSVANSNYLYNLNDKLAWTDNKTEALKFTITEGDPTANEAIANEVEGVKVIAGNGTVEIQGAAGKNVVIANILGKVVASTTLTSDNQTINVPAGIVVVTVDGEAVKAVVR